MTEAGISCRKEILTARHLILMGVRKWFLSNGFIEVQPPVISDCPLPESTVDFFEIKNTDTASYLLPSPELYLKPLLSIGLNKFFSIGPAFRKGEKGLHHLPEFTMLEWYRSNSNYYDLIKDCQGLLSSILKELRGSDAHVIKYNGKKIDLAPPYKIMTIEEAFKKFAGWNPVQEKDERRFEEDLMFKVEPNLPENSPVFIKDFPAWAASLAKLKATDTALCERVELFAGGLELANGFSELLDPEEQRARFELENQKRLSLGMKELPIPERFLSALGNCPPSAGMALGLDRLVMLFTDTRDISQTNISFCPLRP